MMTDGISNIKPDCMKQCMEKKCEKTSMTISGMRTYNHLFSDLFYCGAGAAILIHENRRRAKRGFDDS